MKKFLIVYFHWWVDLKKIRYEILEFNNLDEAKKHADLMCYRKQDTFNKVVSSVFELLDNQTINKSRKLSLWERISGKTKI